MRSWTMRVVGIALFAFFVASAKGDGPQFTGLLNLYSTSGSGFDKTGNSLARMDRNGPIAGTVVSLPGNWSDIVVAPDNSAYYAIVNFNQEFYRIDPVTKVATKMTISGP